MGQTTEEAVKSFKVFVKNHPELIKGVKEQEKTWKDVFDEFVLFGEDHEIWEAYGIGSKEPKKKPRGANELMRMLDFIGNMDAKTVQDRLEQINGALTNIQELIQIWAPQQSTQDQNTTSNIPGYQNFNYNQPFPQGYPNNFRRD